MTDKLYLENNRQLPEFKTTLDKVVETIFKSFYKL
jgi:hypothetical protein